MAVEHCLPNWKVLNRYQERVKKYGKTVAKHPVGVEVGNFNSKSRIYEVVATSAGSYFITIE